MNRLDAARILIVDDNRAIHDDFRKILAFPARHSALQDLERQLYGTASSPRAPAASFRLEHAHQGMEALELVQRSLREQQPYALAFVDMRMPPGWNGLETIQHLWAADPRLQIVICSAYSDHSWNDITERLGQSDRLLL